MTRNVNCPTCGRPPENGVAVHHLGCSAAMPKHLREIFSPMNPGEDDRCKHDGCENPPKPYPGRGARTQYCADHDTTEKRRPKVGRKKKEASNG